MKIYGVSWSIPIKSIDRDEGAGRQFFSTLKAQDNFRQRLHEALKLLGFTSPHNFTAAWIEEVADD